MPLELVDEVLSVPGSTAQCLVPEVEADCRECTTPSPPTSVIPGSFGPALAIPAPHVRAATPRVRALNLFDFRVSAAISLHLSV